MTDTIEFNSLPTKAQAELIRLSALVAGVVPIETNAWRFVTNTLRPSTAAPTIVIEVAQWAGGGNVYLYTICLVTEQYDLSKIRDAFSAAKATQYGRAYPRINGQSQSRCLYVGSSKKVHQRLKEHLGYGAKGTYALHLAHWASYFPLELEFKCAKYQAGLDREVYQVLEDTLWDEVSPMFGRKGTK
jgi:hypothetical protein